ncbi:MAG TPA: MFS transporter [Gammaproteobacteria bacterium]|nr:MFS transporter [Gammaproteobacteria bacterium]
MLENVPLSHVDSRTSGARAPSRSRQLLAASVGNLVEWYDWYAYSFLAMYFADQFFPSKDALSFVPLLATFGVFAAGFFMRPIGGLLLGAIADRRGRRTALTLSIALMGAGSLVIALCPTYAQIGVLAPILLVAARLAQGLSTGGEYAAAATFMIESAAPHRRGLFSSFWYLSSSTGKIICLALVASISTALGEMAMGDYGWRIPFLVGAAAAATGWWIRRHAEETHQLAEQIKDGRAQRPGLFEFIQRYPRQAGQVFGLTVGPAVCVYTWTAFLPTYAVITAGFGKAQALTVGTISLIFFALIQPLGGTLSDRIGRKPMLMAFAAGSAIATVPLLNAIGTSFWSLLLVQCTGMVLLTGYTSIAAATTVELYPSRVRGTGIGFPYSMAMALFGGTTPTVGTWLHSIGHSDWFGWYIIGCVLVTLITCLTLRETFRAPLPT